MRFLLSIALLSLTSFADELPQGTLVSCGDSETKVLMTENANDFGLEIQAPAREGNLLGILSEVKDGTPFVLSANIPKNNFSRGCFASKTGLFLFHCQNGVVDRKVSVRDAAKKDPAKEVTVYTFNLATNQNEKSELDDNGDLTAVETYAFEATVYAASARFGPMSAPIGPVRSAPPTPFIPYSSGFRRLAPTRTSAVPRPTTPTFPSRPALGPPSGIAPPSVGRPRPFIQNNNQHVFEFDLKSCKFGGSIKTEDNS